MTTVLVVEDSATQAAVIQANVRAAGFDVRIAGNGVLALHALTTFTPSVVMTDLQMPEMDGVELIQAIRQRWPATPVVIMTSSGSEEIALQALHAGAITYIPKIELGKWLLPTLKPILELTTIEFDEARFQQSLPRDGSHFVVRPDPAVTVQPAMCAKYELTRRAFSDPTGILQMVTAMTDVIETAAFGYEQETAPSASAINFAERIPAARRHGREVSSQDDVRFGAQISLAKAVFTIRHPSQALRPRCHPSHEMDSARGRAQFLLKTFFDDVQYNRDEGKLTLVKRRVFQQYTQHPSPSP